MRRRLAIILAIVLVIDAPAGVYSTLICQSYATVKNVGAQQTGMGVLWDVAVAQSLTSTTSTELGPGSLHLNPGWNLISLPLLPIDSAIRVVLKDQISRNDVAVVWSYNSVSRSWQSFTPGKSSSLAVMNAGSGYWIYMQSADTLNIEGYIIPPKTVPSTYDLTVGWNLIGFVPRPDIQSETVASYLQSIAGSYDPSNVWILDNSSGNWIRTSTTTTGSTWIQPGEAMWILVTAPATLNP